jgi:hypothetical protein
VTIGAPRKVRVALRQSIQGGADHGGLTSIRVGNFTSVHLRPLGFDGEVREEGED